MLSKSERDAIRARADAATNAPWQFWGGGVVTAQNERIHDAAGHHVDRPENCPSCLNSEFIAHARTDVPALLDELDAKDAELAELAELKADLGAGCYENGCMAHAVEALRQRAEAAESALACERANYAEEIKLRQACERLLAEAKRDTGQSLR